MVFHDERCYMIISFIGHSFVFPEKEVKEILQEQIINNIPHSTPVTCYTGGYGDFDQICAHVCKGSKKEYQNIEVVYITPYLNQSEQTKIKLMQESGLCDSSIYPPIENIPLKFAILKRNEWMIDNSDMIIAYVNHSFGGAYKSLLFAKRKKKKIINICDFLNTTL